MRQRPAVDEDLALGEVQEQFRAALASFVEKAQRDTYLTAVILFGSMSHDSVWAKSDIDLMLIGRDEREGFSGAGPNAKTKSFAFVENDVNIHAIYQSRSGFKKLIDGGLQGSFMHSAFSKSKLIWTRDETVRELYDNANRLGARDRQVQLLRAATMVLPTLYKAQKWFHVKKDLDYSFVYIMASMMSLAQVEVLLNNEVPGREVIQQAMRINPSFFKPIYSELINKKKTAKDIEAALARIDQYLTKKIRTLFQPILDFLADAGSIRGAGEIDQYFKAQMHVGFASLACEWLADKDVIAKASTPILLTKNSRVEFNELAFYYDGDEFHG